MWNIIDIILDILIFVFAGAALGMHIYSAHMRKHSKRDNNILDDDKQDIKKE